MAYLQELRKLSLALQDKLVSFAPYASRAVYADGKLAQNSYFMAGNIVADEDVVIGADTYRCKALTTDTTANLSAAGLADLEPVSLLTLTSAPGVAVSAGDLFRVENEIVKIEAVVDAATWQYRVIRARCGTTVAAHAGGTDVFQAAVATTTQIPVGVNATLTPAVYTAALVQEINNAAATGGIRASAKASTIYDPGATYADGVARPDSARAGKVNAILISTDTVLVTSAIPENSVLATTETTTNGAWQQGATLIGGAAVANKVLKAFSRVPTAAEVTKGSMLFKLDFTPSTYIVQVLITATGVAKGWVGGVTIDADPSGSGCTVIVDNTGGTDWAATDTVFLTCAS